jgi:hypothetical protein
MNIGMHFSEVYKVFPTDTFTKLDAVEIYLLEQHLIPLRNTKPTLPIE